MGTGFYDELGVDPTASAGEVRGAYTRVVAELVRKRRDVVEQGAEPEALDLARQRADEAWNVLSDPTRRARYDALLAVNPRPTIAEEDLWAQVSGALIPPPVAAAAELLARTTTLDVGDLPARPGTRPRADQPRPVPVPSFDEPSADDRTVPTAVPAATEVTAAVPPRAAPESTGTPVIQLHQPRQPGPDLRVVDGASSSPVIVLPTASPSLDEPEPSQLSDVDISGLVAVHGFSGPLLRAAREAHGLSLQDLSDSTRISTAYLSAIESDDLDSLPSATFVRGYVREMARQLGLDAEAVSAGYMARNQQ